MLQNRKTMRIGYNGMKKGKYYNYQRLRKKIIKSLVGGYMLAHCSFLRIFMLIIRGIPKAETGELPSEEETLSVKCRTYHSATAGIASSAIYCKRDDRTKRVVAGRNSCFIIYFLKMTDDC